MHLDRRSSARGFTAGVQTAPATNNPFLPGSDLSAVWALAHDVAVILAASAANAGFFAGLCDDEPVVPVEFADVAFHFEAGYAAARALVEG